MSFKIAIVVHGRFHAFDLARELLKRRHDVTLFTHYPRWAVRPFGVPTDVVRSFWPEGVLDRVTHKLHQWNVCPYPESYLHRGFSRWAAQEVLRERWDAVVCWSGVCEEVFRALGKTPTVRICHRSSSHIRTQARLLQQEEGRVGRPLDRPSPWILGREEREYELADVIYAPSTFVKETFLAEGISADRVRVLRHGVNTSAFRPASQITEARCARLLAGEPIRVLNVGTFSFRKGMWDMAEVIRRLHQGNFRFQFVGPIAPEASSLASELRRWVRFLPAMPQQELPSCYAWGDVFVLPTIEDGFPFVLAQACAAGLVIVTTPNGAGVDLVREGETGWLVPIRNPQALIERLRWCDSHRGELVEMVRWIDKEYRPRDWADVAADFEKLCLERLKR